MKELKLSKYSKAWFIKRNDRLTKLVIVLFWFIPIFGGVLASFIKLKNIVMSIVVVFIFMLNLAMLLYITDSINENYNDYIHRLISKRKRKQDRKLKKWLI